MWPCDQSWRISCHLLMGFPDGSNGKESACNAGDLGSIPGSGRSLREGIGNPLVFLPGEFPGQRSLVGYSSWVAKSQTCLSDYTTTNKRWEGSGHIKKWGRALEAKGGDTAKALRQEWVWCITKVPRRSVWLGCNSGRGVTRWGWRKSRNLSVDYYKAI